MSPWPFRRRYPRRRPRDTGRRRGRRDGAGVHDWPQLLDRGDVLILDTETTGLGRESEVIEVALINTRGEELLHRLALPLGSIRARCVPRPRPDENQIAATRRR